jgi:selenocysteine-specific elongation factor
MGSGTSKGTTSVAAGAAWRLMESQMASVSAGDHEKLEDVVIGILRKAKRHALPLKRLQKELARGVESHRPAHVVSIMAGLVGEKVVLEFGRGAEAEYFLAENFGYLKERLVAVVAALHRRFPYEPAVTANEIKKNFSETRTTNTQRNIDSRLFDLALSACKQDGAVAEAERGVRLPDFQPQTGKDAAIRKIEDQVFGFLAANAHGRFTIEDLSRRLKRETRQLKATISGLLEQGRIVRIDKDRYLDIAAIARAKQGLVVGFRNTTRMRIQDITALLGISRSAAVPLMEYLDFMKFTRRDGDYRELNRASEDASFVPNNHQRLSEATR